MASNFAGAARVGATASGISSSGVLHRLKAFLARVEERSRIHFELSQMTSRELADLGLSQSEIPNVVRGTYRRSI